MRHLKKGNHLGRTASHKKAMMRNMAAQVIEHKEIKTTLAKAKELRTYVERMITYGKRGSVHHRRLAFKFLQNKEAVTELFETIAPSFEDRPGGYSRIIRLGNRKGDNAEIAIFQLVGFETISDESVQKEKKSKDTKKNDNAEVVNEKEITDAEIVEETTAEVAEEKAVEKKEDKQPEPSTDDKATEVKNEDK
jgi:large subunit ribosomal protein L17